MSLSARLGLPNARGAEPFIVALLVDALGTGLYVPFSLLYFIVAVALPLPAVGVALSLASALSLPLSPIAGVLVDQFGARRVVIAAQLLQAVGFFGYLIVGNPVALFIAAAPVAVGSGMFWAAFGPLVAAIAAPDERDRWYALAGSAQNVGFGLGGLLAALIAAAGGGGLYRALVAANALSFLLSAGFLLRLRERRRQPEASPVVSADGYRTVLRDRPFLAFLVSNVAFALCATLITVALPLYFVTGLHAPVWTVGVALALNTALLALAQTAVVRLGEPYRRTRLVVVAGVVWITSMGLFAFAPAVPDAALVPFLLVAVAIYTGGELIHVPTANALVAAVSPDHLRGRYMALFQLSWGMARTIAPTLFAVLFAIRPTLPWVAVAALTLGAIAVVLWAERRLPAIAVRTTKG